MAKRLKVSPANDRGFLRADFVDLYGSQCSIQKSSLATKDAIWLGVHDGSPHYENRHSHRMHLDQEMVASLLPILERFVKTGNIRPTTRKRKGPNG